MGKSAFESRDSGWDIPGSSILEAQMEPESGIRQVPKKPDSSIRQHLRCFPILCSSSRRTSHNDPVPLLNHANMDATVRDYLVAR